MKNLIPSTKMEFFLRFIIILGALRMVVAVEETPDASFILKLFASRAKERDAPIVPCNVCGDEKVMQTPYYFGYLTFLGFPYSWAKCRDIYDAGQSGYFSLDACAAAAADEDLYGNCGCTEGTFAPSPSYSPSPYWARSSYPTPSSSDHYSYFPTPLYTEVNYTFACSICGESRYMEYPDAFLFDDPAINCTYIDNWLLKDETECEEIKSYYELEALCGCTKIPTTKKKLGECEMDCDNDSDCKGKLICADQHKKELRKAGHDPRKANCGEGSQKDRYYEVCFDPTILNT